MTKLRRIAGTAALLAALTMAACGDDDGDSGGGAAPDAAPAESTKATVEPPPTEAPTELNITEPLSKPPPKGKTVGFLQCELPVCAVFAQAMKDAVKPLGWNSKSIAFKAAAPGAGIRNAINAGVDYIAWTGVPAAAVKQELAAAKKAGVPVVACSTPDQPAPGGYAAVCGTAEGTFKEEGRQIARWMINDSGGKAKAVHVNIPDYPVQQAEQDGIAETLKADCPDCTFDPIAVTVDEVGAGAVPSKVVAYLQSHPDVDYLTFGFSDLLLNVPKAIKAAGYDKRVTTVGVAVDKNVLKNIVDGDVKAWTAFPIAYSSWVMADSLARISIGEELTDEYHKQIQTLPTYVVDSPEEAKRLQAYGELVWPGPEGFEQKLSELWGAAG